MLGMHKGNTVDVLFLKTKSTGERNTGLVSCPMCFFVENTSRTETHRLRNKFCHFGEMSHELRVWTVTGVQESAYQIPFGSEQFPRGDQRKRKKK